MNGQKLERDISMLKQVNVLVRSLIEGSSSRRVLAERLRAYRSFVSYSDVKDQILHAKGRFYHNEASADHFTRNVGE